MFFFISPSPRTTTILYSCYLCKQCALYLFLHSVNPAVSNWDVAARAEWAQSIPDSTAVFLEQLMALLNGGGFLWSILRQAAVKLHRVDWERQEVKHLNDWERRSIFKVKCAQRALDGALLLCISYTSVGKPCTNTGIYPNVLHRYVYIFRSA